MGYGARPEDWDYLDMIEELTEDLLPVVSDPNAEISEKSKLKTLGKVPSQYGGGKKVVGIGKWTQRRSSAAQVALWSQEPDYGICIQTRRLRALDIDVEGDEVGAIVSFIAKRLPGCSVRVRKNSGKCLFAFYCTYGGAEDKDFSKRTVKVDGGMVEFLATGQQFIAAGTHPSGARYEWVPGGEMVFPTLSPKEFESLWSDLVEEFGIEKEKRKAERMRGESFAVVDPIVEQLDVLDWGNDGQAHIECPFAHEHTTESTASSTSYFPAGTGGYKHGHFVCLHAHCDGRSDAEFMEALDITTLGANAFDPLPALIDDNGVEVLDLPPFERTKNGQPMATVNNVALALARADVCGVDIAYDVFAGEIMFGDRPLEDTDYFELRRRLEAGQGFKAVSSQMMREAVHYVASKNCVDVARDWIKALEWDGVNRLESFFIDYMGCEDTRLTREAGLYLWSAMAGRVLAPGCKADIVPILIGAQGLMKSTAIAAMSPVDEWFTEVSFDENEDNRLRRIKGKVLAEIGEMRGLWASALENVKAFVTRQQDSWVPKYKEQAVIYRRRCMFIGTSNHYDILNDSTGNRRFLPLEVGVESDIDLEGIRRDKDLLWAEAAALFRRGGVQFAEVEKMLEAHNDNYRAAEPWEEMISDWLYKADLDGVRPADWNHGVSVNDVLVCAIGLSKAQINSGQSRKASECLRVLGLQKKKVRVNSTQTRRWFVKANN